MQFVLRIHFSKANFTRIIAFVHTSQAFLLVCSTNTGRHNLLFYLTIDERTNTKMYNHFPLNTPASQIPIPLPSMHLIEPNESGPSIRLSILPARITVVLVLIFRRHDEVGIGGVVVPVYDQVQKG